MHRIMFLLSGRDEWMCLCTSNSVAGGVMEWDDIKPFVSKFIAVAINYISAV